LTQGKQEIRMGMEASKLDNASPLQQSPVFDMYIIYQ
jgi:hypothetical protein